MEGLMLQSPTHYLLGPFLWKPVLVVWAIDNLATKERSLLSNYVGQYNLIDSVVGDRSTPKLRLKAINTLGLKKLWRQLRYVRHAEAKEMMEQLSEWFSMTQNLRQLSDIDGRERVRLQSLVLMKEMWMRLLVYAAAAKCPAELHARRLADGGELLSFVWLLMSRSDLGDVGTSPVDLTGQNLVRAKIRRNMEQ
ncbi:hypothetical protein E2562_023293 [Oryza meyeriana var. granulata]|uniref:DUF4220 domain-containing protein n=1 Tax=Oryza meyeriana var. granulata TaxID=110450 RepID=A0A6G1DMB2_9ORYZ|nr:hypothetical protein E2562_023293 [Oryza meyeriana var. granulata]